MVIFIFVEGNIGAGKSTLVKRLVPVLQKQWPDVHISSVLEPVNEWKNCTHNGQTYNILETFYSDVPRYSYLFQTLALVTRIRAVNESVQSYTGDKQHVILCERSVFTDRYVFVESLFEQKLLSGVEYAAYAAWWEHWYTQLYPGVIGGVIRLETPPSVCADHMKVRDRCEESSVSLDYLTALECQHDTAFARDDNEWSTAPMLRLDEHVLHDVHVDDIRMVNIATMVQSFCKKLV